MLSERINGLRSGLEKYRETGLSVEPLGMAVILAMLQSFEAEAEAMEASRISPVAMAGRDLPDNVIRLAEKLHKQGVRVGVPGGVA